MENAETIGAEYYAPEFLRPYEQLMAAGFRTQTLGELTTLITDGDHGSAEYADSGVPFILSEAVSDGWVDIDACRYVTAAHAKTLRRSELKKGDVLITKTGIYFGKSAVVPEELVGGNMIAHVGLLRLCHGTDPYFVSTFFNSRYGYSQLRRRGIKATRPEIKLVEFEDIRVPLPSDAFQHKVRKTILAAFDMRNQSVRILNQAEASLLTTLSMDTWQPPDPLTYVRLASEVTGGPRFDAEFHSPRYASLQAVLAKRFTLKTLGELGGVLKGDTVPYSEDGTVPIIRSGDLRDIDDDDRFLCAASDIEIFELQRGDILISSIGFGSIGKVQVFDKPGRHGTVGEVTVVRQKELNPYYVAAYLRSRFGQMLIERYITGATGQLHLYAKDVAKIFIPIIPLSQQTIFEENAKAARDARREAKALLARAQRAVEVAIEQGEVAAMALLS